MCLEMNEEISVTTSLFMTLISRNINSKNKNLPKVAQKVLAVRGRHLQPHLELQLLQFCKDFHKKISKNFRFQKIRKQNKNRQDGRTLHENNDWTLDLSNIYSRNLRKVSALKIEI